jgi:hypothetical protein
MEMITKAFLMKAVYYLQQLFGVNEALHHVTCKTISSINKIDIDVFDV